MTNCNIIPVTGNLEDKLPDSLHIKDNGKDFCIIWSTKEITFMPEKDYTLTELEFLVKIGSMFYTFFNNISESKSIRTEKDY